jgi:hypothetical protein
MNPKNISLSPAASDLGLGTMLQQQQEDETDEVKKRRKLMEDTARMTGQSMSPAAMSIFGSVAG